MTLSRITLLLALAGGLGGCFCPYSSAPWRSGVPAGSARPGASAAAATPVPAHAR